MAEEKSEAPSQRRLEKAREEGRSAVSRDLSMLVALSAGLVVLEVQMNTAGAARWLDAGMRQTQFGAAQTFGWAGRTMLSAVIAPALAASGGYAAATLLQTGFLIHGAAVQPDLKRISPLAGVKRLVSPQTLVQMAKSIAKLGVFVACMTVAIRRALPLLPSAPYLTPDALLKQVVQQGRGLVLLLLGAQAAIAGADYAWERMRHTRELRMSFQELKDEHKESEGNPLVKQRLRQLARGRAKRRMLLSVPKSSVVITNPTHYAVALSYERGSQGAPRLVAKGADEVAARIRDLAREHRVPIVANAPLARALFRVEIDTEVPSEHFKAVAEVIAFVWRLGRRAGRL